jgi:hypothetical protein
MAARTWLHGMGSVRPLLCTLPAGAAWVGRLRSYAMGPYIDPVVIRAEDWGPGVALHVRGLIVVPAVQARALCEGPSSGAWHGGLLKTRRAQTVPFQAGSRLTVQASSGRQGELVVVPFGLGACSQEVFQRLSAPQAASLADPGVAGRLPDASTRAA